MARLSTSLAIALLLGGGLPALAQTPTAAARELSPRDLRVSRGGVGPIRAGAKVDLGSLTTLLPGMEVAASSRRVEGASLRILVVSYVGVPVLEVLPGPGDVVQSIRVVSADVPSPSENLTVGSLLDDVHRLERCTLQGAGGADGIACSLKGIDGISFLFPLAEGRWDGKGLPAAALFEGVRVSAFEWRPTP